MTSPKKGSQVPKCQMEQIVQKDISAGKKRMLNAEARGSKVLSLLLISLYNTPQRLPSRRAPRVPKRQGGVIMDVMNPEQAKIAEEAGACAVMALERIPADIRQSKGVARMSDPKMIKDQLRALRGF